MSGIDGAPKELRKVLLAAEREGVTVTYRRGSGHFQLKGGDWILHVSQTPSNLGRCVQRLKSDLRKRGVTV